MMRRQPLTPVVSISTNRLNRLWSRKPSQWHVKLLPFSQTNAIKRAATSPLHRASVHRVSLITASSKQLISRWSTKPQNSHRSKPPEQPRAAACLPLSLLAPHHREADLLHAIGSPHVRRSWSTPIESPPHGHGCVRRRSTVARMQS